MTRKIIVKSCDGCPLLRHRFASEWSCRRTGVVVATSLKQLETMGIHNSCQLPEEPEEELPSWIVDGKCNKPEEVFCYLGYACDGCPFNKQ